MITIALIPITTGLLFGCLYPLLFWSNFRTPIVRSFYQFNLGMSCFFGGLATIALWWLEIPDTTKWTVVGWCVLLFAITAFYWNRDSVHEWLISIPCICGLAVSLQLQDQILIRLHPYIFSSFWAIVSSILGGLVLCASVYAGVLGHWYLNVKTMPTEYLMRATNAFGLLLLIRLAADVYLFCSTRVFLEGEPVPLLEFTMTIEGIFIVIALFFGTLFPVGSIPFIRETIRIKNTQSATGILYVVAISVLMGDLSYRYYLWQYGVAL